MHQTFVEEPIRKINSANALPFSPMHSTLNSPTNPPNTPIIQLRRSPLKLLIHGQPHIQTSHQLKTPTSRIMNDNFQEVPFTPMHKSEGKFEEAMKHANPSKRSVDSSGSNSLGMMFHGPEHPLSEEIETLGRTATKEFAKDPESLSVTRKEGTVKCFTLMLELLVLL